jgi:hypothetical protein
MGCGKGGHLFLGIGRKDWQFSTSGGRLNVLELAKVCGLLRSLVTSNLKICTNRSDPIDKMPNKMCHDPWSRKYIDFLGAYLYVETFPWAAKLFQPICCPKQGGDRI